MKGKRVLEVGFADEIACVSLADRGARVVAIDPSASRVAAVRQVLDDEGLTMDLRQGDLADLAFLRAETVDAAYSGGALDAAEDFERVLRQVHRVLRPDGVFVFTLPHPAAEGRDYFAGRTIGQLFSAMHRNNFRIDTLLEPAPTLIVRARREGR